MLTQGAHRRSDYTTATDLDLHNSFRSAQTLTAVKVDDSGLIFQSNRHTHVVSHISHRQVIQHTLIGASFNIHNRFITHPEQKQTPSWSLVDLVDYSSDSV